MKYTELLQLKNFFSNYKKLNFLRRIDDNILELSLDKNCFIIDLNRNKSGIYTAKLQGKNYNAPFDVMLKKYFTSVLLEQVEVLENNRILSFSVLAHKSYKSYKSIIYFEFTGKNTNAIICDEKNFVIEALRHIDKSYRIVKPGVFLEPLKAFELKEQYKKIIDFKEYFEQSFQSIYKQELQNQKNNKISKLEKKILKLKQNLEELEDEKTLLQNALDLSQKADLLLANLSFLKDYERQFCLKGFNGEMINFKLQMSPKESANLFYKNAKKSKQKAKNIKIQKENLKEKLDFFSYLKGLLSNAQSVFELEILAPKTSKKKKEEVDYAVADFYFKGFKISVGRNQKANQYLLENSKKNDLWLHVKNIPSAHTIISSNKQKISEEVLQFAAKLCVNFSNLNSGVYLVDYTTRNFVRIKEKAFVNYTNFQSISILKE